MKRAGIYVRVSIDRDGRSESPERQEADCRGLCASHSIDVEDVYVDRDVSGYKDVKRPGYRRMIGDLRDGRIDTIVVWKIDRLTRQGLSGINQVLEELKRVKGRLLSYHEHIDDSPMGEAMLTFIASMAKQESMNTSLRTQRAHADAAAKGRMHSGGTRKFGYERGAVREDEAETIREVYGRAIAGESMRSIATDLNARGCRTPTGKEWRSNTLANSLRSPRIAGLRFYNGVFYEGTWEPILTRDEHLRLLAAISKAAPAPRGPNHLLTGLVRCGLCGGNLKTMGLVMKNGRSFPRYQCVKQPGQIHCGGIAVTKNSLDQYVADTYLAFLAKARLTSDKSKRAEEELARLLADDQQALIDLSRARFVTREIGDLEFGASKGPLDERIAETQAKLNTVRRLNADASNVPRRGNLEDLQHWWSALSIPEKRATLRNIIDTVFVHPAKRRGGNKFDTSRIEFCVHEDWYGYSMSLTRHPAGNFVDPFDSVYVKPAGRASDWTPPKEHIDRSYYWNERRPNRDDEATTPGLE